jgi:DNA invertase Pin-like site-specific DNA recombinase
VSFVSVTQQFNTTTSMGRLTLNVLLSFAQFEREVTGERIRDKIAASKKKGMWMGGMPPLGYRVRDHKLVIVPGEADTVRHIFPSRWARCVCSGTSCSSKELSASNGPAPPAGAGAASRSRAARFI